MRAECIRCGNYFDNRGDDWKTYCARCYKAMKNQEADEVRKAWNDGYSAGRIAGRREGRESVDIELIQRAVRLTHPDRHPPERFEEANALTALLLALVQGRRSR